MNKLKSNTKHFPKYKATYRGGGEWFGGNVCIFDDFVNSGLGGQIFRGRRQRRGHPVLEFHLCGPDVWSWFPTAETSIEFEIKLLLRIADIKQEVTEESVEHQCGIDLINAYVLLLIYILFEGRPPTVHL